MAANALPPVPYKTPIMDATSGLMNSAWTGFFRELFSRVGGTSASTNSQLHTQITNLQSASITLQAEVNGLSQGRQL